MKKNKPKPISYESQTAQGEDPLLEYINANSGGMKDEKLKDLKKITKKIEEKEEKKRQ